MKGARNKACDLSVCGNLTNDLRLLYFFMGVGIRSFSIEPHMIPSLQEFIAKVDIAKAEDDARKLLTLSTVEEVKNFLEEVVPG